MSQSSSANGDSAAVANGDSPVAANGDSAVATNGDSPAAVNGDSAAAANGHSRAVADGDSPVGANGHSPAGGIATRPNRVSLAQALDWRLRSLRPEPKGNGPSAKVRTDHGQALRRRRLLAKVAVLVAVAALAVLLLQAFVIQPFAVPGNAMAPTLQAGDRILVLKSGLLAGPIHSGEIVVFHPPRAMACSVVGARGGDLVRRVVALPGQVIWSVGDTIFVNGRPLHDRGWYDRRFGEVGSTSVRSTTLARDQYFVMSDNRSDACDSRVFGPISKSSVVGEGIAVVGRHGHVFFGTL